MSRSGNPFIRLITNLLIDNALSRTKEKVSDVLEVTDQVLSGHNRNSQGHEDKKHTLVDSLSGKYAKEARKDIDGASRAWLKRYKGTKTRNGYFNVLDGAASHAHQQEIMDDMEDVVTSALRGNLKDRKKKPLLYDQAMALKEFLSKK